MLHRGSNCPLSRAMDGRIMRHGIISSCQSAATSEIVKRCCSSLCKQRYSKYSDLYLYLYLSRYSLSDFSRYRSLRRIKVCVCRIQPILDFSTAHAIGTSLVHSKLDYCNSLYCCLLKNPANSPPAHSGLSCMYRCRGSHPSILIRSYNILFTGLKLRNILNKKSFPSVLQSSLSP